MKDQTITIEQYEKLQQERLDDASLEVFGVEFNDLIPEHKKMVTEEFSKSQLEIINEMMAEHINQTITNKQQTP